MKKLFFLPLLLVAALLFSFNNINNVELKRGNYYLPANCEEPIHFQIESQEPYNAFVVNPDNGLLSLSDAYYSINHNSFNSRLRRGKITVNYSVTNADGVTTGNFIIIDLEVEE